MHQGVFLVLVDIGGLTPVQDFARDRMREEDERELAGPINQRREFNVQGSVVLDLQGDRTIRPTRLNPRGRLMHAHAYARIRASSFHHRDHVWRDGDPFMCHRQHELSWF